MGSALSSGETGLSEAVAVLADAIDGEGLPARIFVAIATVIDADLLSYNDVNLATGEVRFVLRPRVGASGWRPAPFLRRFGYHPAATGLAGYDDASPRFIRDPKLRALGVGNCCGEAEIRLNAGLSLSAGESRLVGVGVSLATRSFDDRERALLTALQPHLAAAFARALERSAVKDPVVAPTGRPQLTRRENEVMYWVAMGKTNEEIAAIIGARPLTVKKHLEHVYAKLEVPNRTAAALAARELAGGAAELTLPARAAAR